MLKVIAFRTIDSFYDNYKINDISKPTKISQSFKTMEAFILLSLFWNQPENI